MKQSIIEKFFGITLSKKVDQIVATCDSRQVTANSIFFALKGEKTDGHNFLNEVENKKALIAVVEPGYARENSSTIYITSLDPLKTLQDLSSFQFKFINAKTIAVTGSCGKSTTKEYLYQLLSTKYKVGKTIGNFNSQVGLPISLIALEGDEQILCLEMGMSYPGEIKKLVSIAPPNIAILTCIASNHIEFFGTKEKIAEEKKQIFSSPKLELGIISKQVTEFINPENFIVYQEEDIKNLAPALIVAKLFGISEEDLNKKIPTLTKLKHRLENVDHSLCKIIDDSYNSSLESLEFALDSIIKRKDIKKKIAVIGALAEQGDLEKDQHLKLGQVLDGKFDEIYLIGIPTITTEKYLKNQGQAVYYYNSLNDIAKKLKKSLTPNDLLFLKGANCYRLWEIIELLN